jgi:hypothetical protein
VTNELYGPSAGDAPVLDTEIVWGKRGDRGWPSRLVMKPKRPTRFVRVIGAPHVETCDQCNGTGYWGFTNGSFPSPNGVCCSVKDGIQCAGGLIKYPCVLATAYGVASIDARQSPKEPGDLVRALSKMLSEQSALEHAMLLGVAKKAEAEQRLEELRPKIEKAQKEYLEAEAFWKVHGLAAPLSMYPCATCGAPNMGDAVYDAYEGVDPDRCQTCGYL